MRAAFFTLGCKVNQYETSVMTQRFAAEGFDIVDPDDEADVYVVNSCTVTATGDKKSRQMVRRFRRQNPTAVVCLCGCFPQAFPDAAEQIPEADVIMGARNRSALLDAVKQRLAGGQRVVQIVPHEKGEAFETMRAAHMGDKTRAFVKIQDGCERYCAYCIIPKARGPVRSKPLEEIRAELEGLAAAGYREIVYAGINLPSYGQDIDARLLDAIRVANGIDGIQRIRLGSLEPENLPAEDIAAMAAMDKLCPQFHLSLQSGCDATLRRMRRHYDTAMYRDICRDLRAAFPHCALTTDIMVGFPGETEEEHAASLAFARDIGFAKVHVFAYSRRPGTTAAAMADQVENSVKVRRSHEMATCTAETRRAFLDTQIGSTFDVLFEDRENGHWCGYTANYTPVRVASDADLSGRILPVKLTGHDGDTCTGSLAHQ
ncbi:tRNA (N(6)-L-threonylcarbamoyladenosine(37)-C(2))-methylthiotransferase MtaB [Ruminococcaceae bacterium OttesenSCG-928-L11]|nr:tRNA (N(6)-L-threonylcarbamoyladenosine(37)-C(2))-methylthiotransferase MtaB [Ruminococcaceae bacterium OttesenSCG-928-L11]